METKKTIKVSEETRRAGKVFPLFTSSDPSHLSVRARARVCVGGVYLLHDGADDDDGGGGGGGGCP